MENDFFYKFVKLEQPQIMNRITLLALLSIFCLCSCNSEKDNILPNPINEIEEEPCLWDAYVTKTVNQDSSIEFLQCPFEPFEHYIGKYRYSYPEFNPKNPNELAYIRYDNEGHGLIHELWIFDFCTGENRYVTDKIMTRLDWSVKDWLLFTGKDRQLWKIKSNGDSLTQLTFSGFSNYNAKWHPTKDSFIFKKNAAQTHAILATGNGNHLDTFPAIIYSGEWAWKNERELYVTDYFSINGNDPGFGIFNFDDESRQMIHPLNLELVVPENIVVSPVNEEFSFWQNYSTSIGIGKSWRWSTDYSTFKDAADNRLYSDGMTISPDNSKIVVVREDRRKTGMCDLEIRKTLHYIDLETLEEYAIHLPE
jgi:hypothetical protein